MTQDEIVSMARESGLGWVAHKRLERFANLVAAHEREKAIAVFQELEREVKAELINAINGAVELECEACAKVCEGKSPYWERCAAAIRARNNKE